MEACDDGSATLTTTGIAAAARAITASGDRDADDHAMIEAE